VAQRLTPFVPTPARLALGLSCILLAGCSKRVSYYDDGVKRSEGGLSFVSRKEHGLWTYWYPNGEVREEGRYDDGVRVGVWTQWFPNGQRRNRGERVKNAAADAGERHGVWTFWHPSGELAARGVYEHGRREGRWDCTLMGGGWDGSQSGQYANGERLQ
jgi:uncharacterized protein